MAKLVLVAALLTSCSDSEPSDAAATTDVPSEPAECSGPARIATADARGGQWRAAAEQVAAAGEQSVEIWVGFSDVITVQEAEALLGSLRATGVFLAYPGSTDQVAD